MTFDKEWLRETVAWGPALGSGVTILYKTIVDSTRWSLVYEAVFEFESVCYKTSYRVGATEYQDEDPYEYDDDPVTVEVVEPCYTIHIDYLTADEITARGVKTMKVDGGPPPALARLYVTDKQTV